MIKSKKTNIIILSIIIVLSLAFMYFICTFKIKQYSTTFEEIKTAISNDLELQEEQKEHKVQREKMV